MEKSNNDLFELITSMYSNMQEGFSSVNKRLDNLENRIDNLEKQVNKNTLTLEGARDDIKLLAEGQSTISNQLGKSSAESSKSINDRLEVIELAVTDTSSHLNNVDNVIRVVKETTANNALDIKILQSAADKRMQS
ncbi:hypothetical protein [Clostridium butyricum]|uniref:hypothetical protein n=1 Tax=Clostridium butyricum TaxID=1492 RepID=UPI00374EB013